MGCLQFAFLAWKMKQRVSWTGRNDEQLERKLQKIINNNRFLILPWSSQESGQFSAWNGLECRFGFWGEHPQFLTEIWASKFSAKKKFYLLDTFCGLSGTLISDEEEAIGRKSGGYEECYEDVRKTFKDFSNVQIIKGIIPDTLIEVKAEKIVFLSIDMNCAAPEIAAAEYFWERIVRGGIILLDDYNYCGYEPQMKAFDEFAFKRGVRVLALPTGQGLIIKP